MATSYQPTSYQILGVTEQASVEEIKHAYRRKAKQLHPDRNQSPEAHQQFILLNEAYDNLIELKTKPRQVRPQATPYDEWRRQEMEKNRQRAQAYAQMRYEEYIKTDGYKATSSWAVIGEHFYYFFAVAALSIFPLLATILYGYYGLGASIVTNLLISPLTVDALRDKPNLDWVALRNAVLYIIKTESFLYTATTFVNTCLLLKVGLQTLIPLHITLGVIGLCMLVVFLVRRKWQKTDKFRHNYYSFCLVPFAINMLLLINFVFSFNPTQETYNFQHVMQQTQQGYRKSTLIVLEKDKYADFPGIRVFWDYSAMADQDEINYTFRNGMLGARVMTDFSFSTKNP